MRILVTLLLLITLTSCANYINKIHSELDRGETRKKLDKRDRDMTFAQFRNPKYRSRPNSSVQKNLLPRTKRLYQKKRNQRVKADDLADNTSSASLWTGNGNDNYLFTKNKWKRNGDIVLLQVKKRLKDEITMELKRTFPVMPKKKPNSKGTTNNDTNAAAAEQNEEPTNGSPDKIYDKISSVIIEEISKDHLLIRGQKFLLFRNRKHLVEVQALVARKDIMDDDTIESTQILESTVTVLR